MKFYETTLLLGKQIQPHNSYEVVDHDNDMHNAFFQFSGSKINFLRKDEKLTLIVDWLTVNIVFETGENFTTLTSLLWAGNDKISSLVFKSQSFAVRSKRMQNHIISWR